MSINENLKNVEHVLLAAVKANKTYSKPKTTCWISF